MKVNKTYNLVHKLSAVFMVMSLLWLTISLPFVISNQQQLSDGKGIVNSGTSLPCNEEEAANGLNNTTEEKAPGNASSFSEEYLHEHHSPHHSVVSTSRYHSCEDDDTYHAYHGEVQVPPPNA